MSTTTKTRRRTARDIRAAKGGTPQVWLTAYTTPMARQADAHCDVLLVGDSLGMVLHGMDSTLGVTVDMMILHARAVMRGAAQAMVVVDLPFGSYEAGPAQAFDTAARVMRETGAGAVKLEGGRHMADTIAFLVARGIPVVAHVGLTPQAVNTLGGYGVQGRGDDGARVMADARAVSNAGACAVVLENLPAGLADRITADIEAPTIGIGASAGCDGQVLVSEDMLGLFGAFKPRFVRRYADLSADADRAIAAYAADVRARAFPDDDHITKDK